MDDLRYRAPTFCQFFFSSDTRKLTLIWLFTYSSCRRCMAHISTPRNKDSLTATCFSYVQFANSPYHKTRPRKLTSHLGWWAPIHCHSIHAAQARIHMHRETRESGRRTLSAMATWPMATPRHSTFFSWNLMEALISSICARTGPQ